MSPGDRGLLSAVAVLSLGVYALALGLTKRKTTLPNGMVTGPYDTAEVALAVGLLLVLTIIAGIVLPGWPATLSVTVGFTIGFTINSLLDPNLDGLFVIGAGLLVVGLGSGAMAVSTGARWVSRRLRHRPVTLAQAAWGNVP